MKIKLTTLIVIVVLAVAGTVGVMLLITNKDFGLMRTERTNDDGIINAQENVSDVEEKINNEIEEKNENNNQQKDDVKITTVSELKELMKELNEEECSDYYGFNVKSIEQEDDYVLMNLELKKPYIINEEQYNNMKTNGNIIIYNKQYKYYSEENSEYIVDEKQEPILHLGEVQKIKYYLKEYKNGYTFTQDDDYCPGPVASVTDRIITIKVKPTTRVDKAGYGIHGIGGGEYFGEGSDDGEFSTLQEWSYLIDEPFEIHFYNDEIVFVTSRI